MSDDKQLTVAELLARAQQNKPDGEQPRRRRRRSLDDGGVSVAELTGSLKKVDARPAESRHSSVPIDTPTVSVVNVGEPDQVEPPTASWTKIEQPHPQSPPVQTRQVDALATHVEPVESAQRVEQDAPSTASTGVLPAVTDADVEPDNEGVDIAQSRRLKESEEPAETDSINPILLVLFVFAGLVAGVAGFFAFQWVWANLPMPAAIVAALAVTAAIVVGVRFLRTGKDGLTMSLAGLAGLVVTFGPGLISGF